MEKELINKSKDKSAVIGGVGLGYVGLLLAIRYAEVGYIVIGLVNEMRTVADKMGIDVHEVIDAAVTKPFGVVLYYPGTDLGGRCVPINPFT